MKSWRNDLPAETLELIRIFEAMSGAADRYGRRWMELTGDFGEGMNLPTTKLYGDTFTELVGQLEDVAAELCRIFRIEPEQWIDTENDVLDGDTYAGAAISHLAEMDACDLLCEVGG